MNKQILKERKTKNQKGITLVSLVITVIVLLILATVAITLAVNSNGLFAKTGTAANNWNAAVQKENDDLTNLMNFLDELIRKAFKEKKENIKRYKLAIKKLEG